ncbi:MAG: hypothetical protein HY648_05040 [Acidobacteria bacterium]|nr:hypothetical protein [Acidobacteriota bacterium]
MIVRLLILGIIAVATGASAQEPAAQGTQTREEAPIQRGFHLSSPLMLSAVREKGIPVGQSRFNDDVLLLTAPEFAFRSALPRTDFFLGYKPEGQLFRRHHELKTLDHMGRMRLTHRRSSRLMLDAQNNFLQTEDPGRLIGDSIFILPRSQFLGNTFSFTADYDLTPQTKISPSYLNTFSKLLLPNIRETELFTGRFEQTGNAAGVAVSHMLDRQNQVAGTYSFYVIQDLKRGIHLPFTNGSSTHGVGLSYQYGFDPRGVSLMLSAGTLFSGGTTYRVAARFEKRWTSLVFATGFSREVSILGALPGPAATASPIATGALPQNFYEMAMLRLEGTLAERWGVEFSTYIGKSNSGLQIEDIKGAFGHLRLSYRLMDRVYPFVGADINSQGFSEWLQTSLARRRYFAGIAFVFSPLPERRGVLGETEAWPDESGSPRTLRRRE